MAGKSMEKKGQQDYLIPTICNFRILTWNTGPDTQPNLKMHKGQVWWFMPVIPAIWEVEIGRSRIKASLGKS
jgi:hypothetical protein